MFDFYFQSGEFGGSGGTDWWSVSATFFGSLIGAGIGVGGAIWVFKKGKKKEKEQKEEDEKTQNVERLEYFNLLINASLETIMSVVKECKKQYSIYESSDKTTFPAIYFMNSYALKRIVKKLNYDLTFKAYKKLIRDKKFNIIMLNLDYFYTQIEELKTIINDNIEQNHKEKNDFLDNIQEIINKIIEIISQDLESDPKTNDVLHKIVQDYYIKLYNNQDSFINMTRYQTLIIEPLSELIIKYPKVPHYKSLLEFTTKVNRSIIAMSNNTADNFQNINKIVDTLEGNYKIFIPLLAPMRSHKDLKNETN